MGQGIFKSVCMVLHSKTKSAVFKDHFRKLKKMILDPEHCEVADEKTSRSRFSRKATGLPGCHVAVLLCERFVTIKECRLAHHEIDAVGELERGVTPRSVHDEGEGLTGPMLTHLLDRDGLSVDDDVTLGAEPADVGALDASSRESIRQHASPVGLIQSPTERVHSMLQTAARQYELRLFVDLTVCRDGTSIDRHMFLADGGQTEVLKVGFTARRVVNRHREVTIVERQAHQDARKAEAVVAVEVGDADPGDRRSGHIREDELALRALSRIAKDPFPVPAKQVPVVSTPTRRRLTR
jgi:hypothetical protein